MSVSDDDYAPLVARLHDRGDADAEYAAWAIEVLLLERGELLRLTETIIASATALLAKFEWRKA